MHASALRNRRWLGFELSVLRRIKFNSIAIPFAGQPDLDWYLKFWGKQVLGNDICQWAWWMSRALVENQQEDLSEDDVARLLHNAYVPRRQMHNPALKETLGEMDACWFDNVWLNIQEIENEHRRGHLGDQVVSKEHYLQLITHFLAAAVHIPKWAIAHAEDGFVTAAELGEIIKGFRSVEVTYTKDFSDVMGGLNIYIIIA